MPFRGNGEKRGGSIQGAIDLCLTPFTTNNEVSATDPHGEPHPRFVEYGSLTKDFAQHLKQRSRHADCAAASGLLDPLRSVS